MNMNFIWGVLDNHRGTINQSGSLTHLFAVLEKTRLGGEHPDFYTLLSALTQVLHGLLLNSWRLECGYPTLKEFSLSNPSPKAICDIARTIMEKYTVPSTKISPTNPKAPPKDLNMNTGASESNTNPTPASSASADAMDSPPNKKSDDIVHQNIILLTRDLLYVTELV